MRVGTVTVEHNRTVAQSAALDLNARKDAVLFHDQIVTVVLTERNRHAVAGPNQVAHDAQFGDIARAFRISLHTRVHVPMICNADATSRSYWQSERYWSGRRESNPRCLLGRQKHYHYATP